MAVTEAQRLGTDIFIDIFDSDDVRINSQSDFTTAVGRNNLIQAIIIRLKTRVGELELHPDYGSRLPDLIGTTPNDFTLATARQHVREAMAQEPRIKPGTLSVKATFSDATKTTIQFEIRAIPIDSEEELNIVWPLIIQGES